MYMKRDPRYSKAVGKLYIHIHRYVYTERETRTVVKQLYSSIDIYTAMYIQSERPTQITTKKC